MLRYKIYEIDIYSPNTRNSSQQPATRNFVNWFKRKQTHDENYNNIILENYFLR